MKHELNLPADINEAKAARHLERMMKDRPKNTRLVSRGQVFIQRPNEQPEQIDIKSIIELPPSDNEDQIWMRMYKLTEEWSPIDYGWVLNPSRILITNMTGMNLALVPDEAARQEINQNIVELTFEQNITEPNATHLMLHPGDTQNIVLNDFSALRIRTRKAGTKIKIHAFPSN